MGALHYCSHMGAFCGKNTWPCLIFAHTWVHYIIAHTWELLTHGSICFIAHTWARSIVLLLTHGSPYKHGHVLFLHTHGCIKLLLTHGSIKKNKKKSIPFFLTLDILRKKHFNLTKTKVCFSRVWLIFFLFLFFVFKI